MAKCITKAIGLGWHSLTNEEKIAVAKAIVIIRKVKERVDGNH